MVPGLRRQSAVGDHRTHRASSNTVMMSLSATSETLLAAGGAARRTVPWPRTRTSNGQSARPIEQTLMRLDLSRYIL